MNDDLRERLAEYAHTAWSGWLKYMFEKGGVQSPIESGGTTWVMFPDKLIRWRRQMNTPYADLPESEKTSDRAEADKMTAILLEYIKGFEDEILNTIAEFEDTPNECLQIINERIQLAQHYRAHPNAPRVEEPI